MTAPLGYAEVVLRSDELRTASAPIRLNNDQILALNSSSPFILVAPTETYDYEAFPTRLYVPILCTAFLDSTAGAYGNDGGSTFALCWGSDLSTQIGKAGFYSTLAGSPSFNNVTISDLAVKETYPFFISCGKISTDGGLLKDNAVGLALTSDPLTLGHPDNSLTINLFYLDIGNGG